MRRSKNLVLNTDASLDESLASSHGEALELADQEEEKNELMTRQSSTLGS